MFIKVNIVKYLGLIMLKQILEKEKDLINDYK